jgi:transposase
LNPIEQLFAKLKHWLRKGAQRTTEAVFNTIGSILDTSHQPSAQTTSLTLDTSKPNPIPL